MGSPLIKEPCDLCAAAAAAKETVQEVLESILDSVVPNNRKRPGPPASPTARRQRRRTIPNRNVAWSDPDTPWHFTETVAGPLYGRSRRGRNLKRPMTFSGPGCQCPLCKQHWPMTLEPRAWNAPVKPGECGVCGQQTVKRRKTR
jgi:hypothetical protein